MERHFTVSGFVVDEGRTLLHWHPKLAIWLPPGGHIDPNEDPVQAVLREVLEETGMTTEVVPGGRSFSFTNVGQLPSPLSIIVADVGEGDAMHQHIDLAYVVRPVAGVDDVEPECDHGFVWVSEQQLRDCETLPVAATGAETPLTDDVREVGIEAIALVRAAERKTAV